MSFPTINKSSKGFYEEILLDSTKFYLYIF